MKKSVFGAIVVLAAATATFAVAQQVGHTVTVDEPQFSDQYLAASIIRVVAAVQGDVVAAGRLVIVDTEIDGDVLAAGESVQIRNRVGDDVRAAGRTVGILAEVGGHIVAAGEEVRLEADSSIADWAWLAGRTVSVAGRIGQELRVAGQRVTVSAAIGGDAILVGETIRIESGATIGGDLILQTENDPEIATGATVTGEIIRQDPPEGFEGMDRFGVLGEIGGILFFSVALGIAVLAVYFLFPLFSESTARRIREMPLTTLAAGLAVAILTPLLLAVIFATGVGLIAGFGTLGAYLLILLVGLLFGVAAVGQLGLALSMKRNSAGKTARILAMLLASVVLLLILRIPLLGALVLLAVWLCGLGAVAGELRQRYRQSGRAATAH
jgi:cytoskeletal protein CcmA (bactofilin family)